MFIKYGLTAICFAAGLALFASNAAADRHHGGTMTMQGGGGMSAGQAGHDKMMRRHMRPDMRAERHGRHFRGRGRSAGHRVRPISHLTVEDVRHHFEHRLARRGNTRLKIGEVKKIDDDTITADIVTVDDSLVRRMKIDRHSGRVSRE